MPVSRVGRSNKSTGMLGAHLDRRQVSPAAPMSWIAITQSAAMISRQASSRSFSAKGSPTCTVGRFSSDASSNSADAIEAP